MKVVVIGGGTGLSNILKGLKEYDLDITAIVAISDNGGSTGIIRNAYDIPAVGDIRKALVSLSTQENDLRDIFHYRFDEYIDNHTIGNLVLTAMINKKGNLTAAVESLSKIFNINGTVLPISNKSLVLNAKMFDGTIIRGQVEIQEYDSGIEKIFYVDNDFEISTAITNKIDQADLIIFSSGSLYTSILPVLIVGNVSNIIKKSKAKKIYVANIMSENGETNDYTVMQHVKAINGHLGYNKVIDLIIISTTKIDSIEIIKNYKKEKAIPIIIDEGEIIKNNIEIIKEDLTWITSKNEIRHNYKKLAKIINEIKN